MYRIVLSRAIKPVDLLLCEVVKQLQDQPSTPAVHSRVKYPITVKGKRWIRVCPSGDFQQFSRLDERVDDLGFGVDADVE
jgi:hypothetical protein